MRALGLAFHEVAAAAQVSVETVRRLTRHRDVEGLRLGDVCAVAEVLGISAAECVPALLIKVKLPPIPSGLRVVRRSRQGIGSRVAAIDAPSALQKAEGLTDKR